MTPGQGPVFPKNENDGCSVPDAQGRLAVEAAVQLGNQPLAAVTTGRNFRGTLWDLSG